MRLKHSPPSPARSSPHTILFTGGCRSGKSGLAQRWVESLGPSRAFVATASLDDAGRHGDEEMIARINRHKAGRGAGWLTLEVPLKLAETVRDCAGRGLPVLVDCVSLWLGNMLGADFSDEAALAEVRRLGELLRACPAPVALVSNEVGLGLVPGNALGRRFRDLAGEANQILAQCCGTVLFVSCGLPLALKGEAPAGLL